VNLSDCVHEMPRNSAHRPVRTGIASVALDEKQFDASTFGCTSRRI
jgi:hypothetical protein